MRRIALVQASLIAAATLAVGAGVGPSPVGAAESPCTVSGGSSDRLVSAGATTSVFGVVVPAGAFVTRIVVETFDDYDAAGIAGDRVVANQTAEQVVILIGGVQVGRATDDVPEVGPNGDRRKASITTTVFSGSLAVSGGVSARHASSSPAANSVQVRSVMVTYEQAPCGGTYPPTPSSSATVVIGGSAAGSLGVTTGNATGSDPGVAPAAPVVPVVPVAPVVPVLDAASGAATGGIGSGGVVQPTPASPLPPTSPLSPPAADAQVASAATVITPSVASSEPKSPGVNGSTANVVTAAARGTTDGGLPVTGSDPIRVVQLAAAAAAAGLGFLVAARQRRRAGDASSSI